MKLLFILLFLPLCGTAQTFQSTKTTITSFPDEKTTVVYSTSIIEFKDCYITLQESKISIIPIRKNIYFGRTDTGVVCLVRFLKRNGVVNMIIDIDNKQVVYEISGGY